jgi:hypothetical protein
VVGLGGVPVTSISVARFAADFRPRCFMVSMIAYIPCPEICRAGLKKWMFSKARQTGVAARAFADFSNHPPGPQIDHRRCMHQCSPVRRRGCCRDYHSHAPESGDGFKRNCRLIIFAIVMSALPPKADTCGATSEVRFGPIADIRLVGITITTIGILGEQ